MQITVMSNFTTVFENVFVGELPEIDFKGEAITFRTTTAAVLDTLAHCAELVTQREEAWRKRLERETERRRRCESLSKGYFEQLQKMRIVHPGPDLEVRQIVLFQEKKKKVFMYKYYSNLIIYFTKQLTKLYCYYEANAHLCVQ